MKSERLPMDQEKELRAFADMLHRYTLAKAALTFDTIEEYIAAKSALFEFVKELLVKARGAV